VVGGEQGVFEHSSSFADSSPLHALELRPTPLADISGARHGRNGRSLRPEHAAVLRAWSVPACLDNERARRFLMQGEKQKNMLGTFRGDVLSREFVFRIPYSGEGVMQHGLRDTEYVS
jgi:hypothetical protein